ncbi:hypothetical protein PPTG_05468 [Phytophthora nicotianae INRA-310]|uniref:Peptidase S1 domain-containing protein n=1 Tax=Phytophthora nicotianae (strain INRA-310) TaxID=761204 RepID=W2QZ49_PHYN3|nr:hypothetical protein PPTG_05468 [Phytophthora nicotianae INRA-310]ETN17734.1 hypothetical protein PPTG_05468 [Phytophthora nicotianae INRA-310]
MKLAAIVRAGILASALAATLTQGYTFSETSELTADSAVEESTGLTVNEEDRIYGGSEADASKYPYIVSLRKDEADDSTFCGGTLIASQYVVTAAHCVKTDENTIYASIGSAFGSGSGDGEQVKVIEGYRHPMYNKSEHLYDVGVLKLEKEVSTDPIDLCAGDGSDNEVGSVATVRGWGLTENGSQSLVLEEVNVKIISNAECNKEYSDRITEGMLCAGEGDGKDTCNGDSGGPLIENDVLIGIVSWGGKCGANAGVYTRVSYMLDYINDIVNGGTGSGFTESVAGSTSEGKSPSTSTDTTEAPSTETQTVLPATKAPATEAPTPAPTTVSPATEAPATVAPQTESPTTDSEDQYAPSTDSEEQTESSSNPAQQSELNTTEAPTSVSGDTQSGKKDCDSLF